MTEGTEFGDVAGESGRLGHLLAEGGMTIVAIEARGSVGIPLGQQFPVQARAKIIDLVGVTDAAVHGVRDGLAGSLEGRRHLDMALGAGRSRVLSGAIGVLIDEQRDDFAIAFELRGQRLGAPPF